jgi:hypothetical protein
MMRSLVNAYGRHIGRLMDGDTFDAVRGFVELFVLAVGAFVLFVTLIALLVVAVSPPENHGSCKLQHHAGKVMVCDEWYPLPETVPTG